jgi:hypothetical protein
MLSAQKGHFRYLATPHKSLIKTGPSIYPCAGVFRWPGQGRDCVGSTTRTFSARNSTSSVSRSNTTRCYSHNRQHQPVAENKPVER